MKTLKYIFLGLISLVFMGCTTHSYNIPLKGQSKEQTNKDHYECMQQARQGYSYSIANGNYNANYNNGYGYANGGYSGYSGSGSEVDQNIFAACMRARGYRVVFSPSEEYQAEHNCQLGIKVALNENNRQKAFDYFQKSCDMGSGCGCYLLGNEYHHIRNNRKQALKYYQKACFLSYQEACKEYKLLLLPSKNLTD